MEMRTTNYHLNFLVTPEAPDYYYASQPLVSGNGNGDDHAHQQSQLRGTLVVHTILSWVSGDGQWTMEGTYVPGDRVRILIYN